MLILLGLLAYTIWYRMHKRSIRRCKCRLATGEVCGCNPERIGQIYPIIQPPGSHPSIDGEKVLAIVLTHCHLTDTVGLAKWEEKYIPPISRRWKLLNEPKSYMPDIELLLRVGDAITVVGLLEKICLPNGKQATTMFDAVNGIPKETPEYLKNVLQVLHRQRKNRDQKAKNTSQLGPVRRQALPV